MIVLKTQEFCEDCPDFEPVVDKEIVGFHSNGRTRHDSYAIDIASKDKSIFTKDRAQQGLFLFEKIAKFSAHFCFKNRALPTFVFDQTIF